MVEDANSHIIIKFIGYMIDYLLGYRKDMFEFEDFKKKVSDYDHVVLLIEYEKKVRHSI